MIKTLSLCPTCYSKIPADIIYHDGAAWMFKECPEHGKFSALVEVDSQFVTAFYNQGTLGRNNSIIIHSYDKCNLACSWCYYPMGKERIRTPDEVDALLGQYRGYGILLSGGEPTIDPEFFDKVGRYTALGWGVSSITNMVRLADDEFIDAAMDSPLHVGDTLNFACSFQHPKNHPKEVTEAKFRALHNMEVRGVRPTCIMFSVQDLSELDFIQEFYERTKGLYPMLRIRGMFRNWKAKDVEQKFFLSDLYKDVCHRFEKFAPTQSKQHEVSNLYCLYMQMDGVQLSLSCAPDVHNIDYHQCSRPVYMMALDGRCYPVPIAQIMNEGVSAGWKDGLRLR